MKTEQNKRQYWRSSTSLPVCFPQWHCSIISYDHQFQYWGGKARRRWSTVRSLCRHEPCSLIKQVKLWQQFPFLVRLSLIEPAKKWLINRCTSYYLSLGKPKAGTQKTERKFENHLYLSQRQLLFCLHCTGPKSGDYWKPDAHPTFSLCCLHLEGRNQLLTQSNVKKIHSFKHMWIYRQPSCTAVCKPLFAFET